ncbi:hypothetical protein AWJ20_645 [Sugiyamaella lignohabitans]|uniref:Integral membrane protein n=1 Tax=Sugiyamaella lignohabitans TaxID=796027 RepID=A0A167D2D5_9ASCO|nr:uncharacterized protein AWJ20_645 [Sugiyamaella lignohabitans]ANB12393.1 hypothetical protein AWJ20_645 [Sugiyamaella lignohabitans]
MKLLRSLSPLSVLILVCALPAVSAHGDEEGHSMDMAVDAGMQGQVHPAGDHASGGMAGLGSSSISAPEMSMTPSPVSMKGHHHHGMFILDDPDLEPQQRAYWEQYNTTNYLNEEITNGKSAKGLLVAHMALTFIAWFFLYPVTVTISAEKNASSVYLVLQTLQSTVALVALFLLALYAPTAPDLYPKNAYGRMSIILFFIVVLHWTSMMIKALARWALNSSVSGPIDGTEYMLANLHHDEESRPSHDSGHGSGSNGVVTPTANTATTSGNFRPDVDASAYDMDGEEDELDSLNVDSALNHSTPVMFEVRLQERLFARLFKYPLVKSSVSRLEQSAGIIYTLINKPLFVFSFVYLLTGVAVFYRLGMANKVFPVLAHFIKGGVFFLFGILTLGRYCGAFANRGMAWNIRPGSESDPDMNFARKREAPSDSYLAPFKRPFVPKENIVSRFFSALVERIPSMEFIECFLIFFYGITNVFLERLANPHGAWAHKDLQHVSIAFMYIGGGLCGLIVESRSFRNLLSSARLNVTEEAKARSTVSFNPIAAFVVFWTGVLMSQHEQETPLATSIHAQWGILFCVAAIFRLFTYLMLYCVPPSSSQPSRPFTELVVSFCLICGGMVFIESNGQTVEAMMYLGLDSMFSLNVNVGFAVLIMSWVMAVLTIKGWLAGH